MLLLGAVMGYLPVGSADSLVVREGLLPFAAERQGQKDAKGEPRSGGDKQQNSVRHRHGGKKQMGSDRFPVLGDDDRYQNSQK
jgi:hypothetical protein